MLGLGGKGCEEFIQPQVLELLAFHVTVMEQLTPPQEKEASIGSPFKRCQSTRVGD